MRVALRWSLDTRQDYVLPQRRGWLLTHWYLAKLLEGFKLHPLAE